MSDVSIPSRSGQCLHPWRGLLPSSSVSIPSRSGQCLHLSNCLSKLGLGFNPLKIGAMPAQRRDLRGAQVVSIPSRSGQCLHNSVSKLGLEGCFNPLKIGAMPAPLCSPKPRSWGVSIPSRSGQCLHAKDHSCWVAVRFNPLKIGAMPAHGVDVGFGLQVSIPSRSGQCLHARPIYCVYFSDSCKGRIQKIFLPQFLHKKATLCSWFTPFPKPCMPGTIKRVLRQFPREAGGRRTKDGDVGTAGKGAGPGATNITGQAIKSDIVLPRVGPV